MTEFVLTATKPSPTDHIWYRNIVEAKGYGADIRKAWEQQYAVLKAALDRNFITRFRTQTPDAASELFFGMAFANAGWTLGPRTTRFDFTFTRPDFPGRLLVEVVTPEPPSGGAWEESVEDDKGIVVRSFDQSSRDEAMLRLTNAFVKKAAIIKMAIEEGHAMPGDYCVIAISGVRIAQEMHLSLESTGLPPDYAEAFLPIGGIAVPITVPKDFSKPPEFGQPRHLYSGQIPKPGKTPVERRAFLCDVFAHVDAVVFTPMNLIGVKTPEDNMTALHNPYADFEGARPMLGLAADYEVGITDEEFSLTISAQRLVAQG